MWNACGSTSSWDTDEEFDVKAVRDWWREQTGAKKIFFGLVFLVIGRFVLRMMDQEDQASS